jgi:sec-independent protein translocase protein TatA
MRLGFGEILVILALALLFFGPSKLPQLGSSLGEAIKGLGALHDEIDVDPSVQEQPKGLPGDIAGPPTRGRTRRGRRSRPGSKVLALRFCFNSRRRSLFGGFNGHDLASLPFSRSAARSPRRSAFCSRSLAKVSPAVMRHRLQGARPSFGVRWTSSVDARQRSARKTQHRKDLSSTARAGAQRNPRRAP